MGIGQGRARRLVAAWFRLRYNGAKTEEILETTDRIWGVGTL